jgi:hypothetical protein
MVSTSWRHFFVWISYVNCCLLCCSFRYWLHCLGLMTEHSQHEGSFRWNATVCHTDGSASTWVMSWHRIAAGVSELRKRPTVAPCENRIAAPALLLWRLNERLDLTDSYPVRKSSQSFSVRQQLSLLKIPLTLCSSRNLFFQSSSYCQVSYVT